jgi:hypothetical protein
MPDMVWVLCSGCIICGTDDGDDEVIVCERPGGGAAPKIFENAASRW